MGQKHIDRLMAKGIVFAPDTQISVPVARDHGYYAGILYPYLVDKLGKLTGYGDKYNVRDGVRWIPGLAAATILDEMPVFPDAGTVTRAGEELQKAGLIRTESTGAFLEPDHVTGRKRDVATWWHVSRDHVALKNIPDSYFDRSQRMMISALEAAAYGVSRALILSYWRGAEPVEQDENQVYKRLSAVELEKALPMDERTARRHLKG